MESARQRNSLGQVWARRGLAWSGLATLESKDIAKLQQLRQVYGLEFIPRVELSSPYTYRLRDSRLLQAREKIITAA